MKRIRTRPRDGWQATIESQGMHFHTLDDEPYWDESVYYQFTAAQIDELDAATCELDRMCTAAAGYVIENRLLARLGIPEWFHAYVIESWETQDFTVYGRFDLAYDGIHPPRLLEYNADTPTGLLEAAVIQWFWLKDRYARADQFNSIHERLIEAWASRRPHYTGSVYFSAMRGELEDFMTVNYLRDTAMQAGIDTAYIDVEDIGWNAARRVFTDLAETPIAHLFKLYPWEWVTSDPFARNVVEASTQWLEPAWKMVLSNKAILPVLWQLFPESPYLLEASDELLEGPCVRKQYLGREGANVAVLEDGQPVLETDGPYDGACIYQRYHPLPQFDGNYPVIGSWMVNGHACGIGIREDTSLITQNTSRFVPHLFIHS